MSKLWPKYENWSKLGTEQQVYRYTLKCTGTLWLKVTINESVPVHVQSVPVQVTRDALKCVFSHIFPYVSTPINSILHIHHNTISNSPCKLFSTQFIFQLHIFLQNSFMNFFQNPSIWVMTHPQQKHEY